MKSSAGFGKRRFDEANTTTIPQGCAVSVCNPTIDPTTNKLIGYGFDASGNTKVDAENRHFIYDGENKQVEVRDSANNIVGKYFYDGDGKRVKKISNTETTVFVYNANGQLVAEYSTQISTSPQVSYLTNDHLGSPRITTDANGQVISRRDFQPFGEEIQRANYGADNVRQKFTSYERDNETNLDYAQARMYVNRLGRFTSADPIMMTIERPSNPQELNLYSYVINNPFIAVDPSGEIVEVTGDAANDYLTALQGAVGAKLKLAKDGKTVVLDGKAPKNLTADQKSLLGLITDKSFTLSVEAVKTDDPNVLVDQYQGGGAMKVDFADLAKIVQPGATTREEQAAHILVEANEGRKAGLKDVGATPEIHNKGIEAGNAVRKRQGLDPRSTQPEATFPTGVRTSDGSTVNTIRYTVNYGTYTQYVYVKAETNSAKRELTPTGTIVASKVIKNTQPK